VPTKKEKESGADGKQVAMHLRSLVTLRPVQFKRAEAGLLQQSMIIRRYPLRDDLLELTSPSAAM
jgi:hypothetical protein